MNHFLVSFVQAVVNKASPNSLFPFVYLAEGRDTKKVPVLVFIHGESYEWNAGNPYDGSVLASFGKVVVVTVNFRLGVLDIQFLSANITLPVGMRRRKKCFNLRCFYPYFFHHSLEENKPRHSFQHCRCTQSKRTEG
ncbi:COesterase domain-containing protein [Caerostris darwini]|uniref:COesterase domain-containing protein n=1 Tax=Caerostris darwini TaxID=1538125 RepID=A0AAV4MHD5_9ARAC|nr:COesterase domain-containing protein [Caerostris darwini]